MAPMFSYDVEKWQSLIAATLRDQLAPGGWNWLSEKAALLRTGQRAADLTLTFAAIPRKTGKQPIQFSAAQLENIRSLRPGLELQDWPADKLSRVWALTLPDPSSKENYFASIELLFTGAEMNELVALYAALPLLAWPHTWVARCTEGIRSNIGTVLETIICHNPYPAEHLPDKAWNQLVLKAFFTEKSIHHITGIDKRNNRELAFTLVDYAHERRAAQRAVNPQLWRCVAGFIDETIFPDIEHLAVSPHIFERLAAALVCAQSGFEPARALMRSHPEWQQQISEQQLTWDKLAHRMESWEYA